MKVAFVFPGQGSQSVGMLDAWRDDAAAQTVVEQASAALGQDLGALMAEGPADTLNLTTNTQPAMLTAGVAVYRAWRAAGGAAPAVVAGHSLGEYAALTAADALTLEDAVRLVRIRAERMQSAVPVGAGGMAAVLGLADEAVIAACQEAQAAGGVVEAVNFNAPAQVVIAGDKDAVARACALAKAAGARRALPLPVSAPFHSSLLEPAAQAFAQALASVTINTPAIPVINNVDVASPAEPAAICDALTRQAWRPVRWVETIRAMVAQGVTHIVECGPGKVLHGLTRRIDANVTALAISDPASLHSTLATLQG